MPEDEPANRRRGHALNPLPGKLARNSVTERRGPFRKLEHERTMEIDRAMQTTRELKVAFQQRARLFELINHFISVQLFTSSAGGMLQFEPECRLTPI